MIGRNDAFHDQTHIIGLILCCALKDSECMCELDFIYIDRMSDMYQLIRVYPSYLLRPSEVLRIIFLPDAVP